MKFSMTLALAFVALAHTVTETQCSESMTTTKPTTLPPGVSQNCVDYIVGNNLVIADLNQLIWLQKFDCDYDLMMGATAGIALAVFIVFVGIFVGIFCCMKSRIQKKHEEYSKRHSLGFI